MDTDSFIVYIKPNYIQKDIAEDVETMFRASNYQLNRPLLLQDHNKAKGKKSVPKKGKLKFGDYKNCLKGINDIVLSSNEGKKIKINLLNRNACINNKDLVIEKEEINCSNIRKRYKND